MIWIYFLSPKTVVKIKFFICSFSLGPSYFKKIVSKKLSMAAKLRKMSEKPEKSYFNDISGGVVENQRFLPYVKIRQA